MTEPPHVYIEAPKPHFQKTVLLLTCLSDSFRPFKIAWKVFDVFSALIG